MSVDKFQNYSEYLSSHLTQNDFEFLEDEDMARHLVELGYRGTGEVLTREEFEGRRKAYEYMQSVNGQDLSRQVSIEQAQSKLRRVEDYTNRPVMKALLEREELIRTGKLSPILFIRDYNTKGQEVSGYIDIAQRMKEQEFGEIFSDDPHNENRLMPRPTDLSYFNYASKRTACSSSPQWQVSVDADSGLGMMFRSRRGTGADRRVIRVGVTGDNGSSNSGVGGRDRDRLVIVTSEYLQAVMYDHTPRKK